METTDISTWDVYVQSSIDRGSIEIGSLTRVGTYSSQKIAQQESRKIQSELHDEKSESIVRVCRARVPFNIEPHFTTNSSLAIEYRRECLQEALLTLNKSSNNKELRASDTDSDNENDSDSDEELYVKALPRPALKK